MALPNGSLPLLVGTGLAVGALALVLWPLLASVDAAPIADASPRRREQGPDEDRPATAIDALREIEFDRATGKLSDADYAALKQRYTQEALAELRAADATAARSSATVERRLDGATGVIDPVEAAIALAKDRQQSCAVCGPRAEPDACYCSSCGRYLPGACAACGTAVELVGSRFCSGCGVQLAAA